MLILGCHCRTAERGSQEKEQEFCTRGTRRRDRSPDPGDPGGGTGAVILGTQEEGQEL